MTDQQLKEIQGPLPGKGLLVLPYIVDAGPE
jgi:hypothetical protein